MIRDLRMQLLEHGAQAAMLCGSGSSVFGIFSSEQAARQAADELGRVLGWRAWVTRTSTKHEPPRAVQIDRLGIAVQAISARHMVNHHGFAVLGAGWRDQATKPAGICRQSAGRIAR